MNEKLLLKFVKNTFQKYFENSEEKINSLLIKNGIEAIYLNAELTKNEMPIVIVYTNKTVKKQIFKKSELVKLFDLL